MNDEGPAYAPIPAAWNDISRSVIACAMEVHTILGPGLLERQYEDALVFELARAGLRHERQRTIRPRYKSIELSDQRLDLVVEDLLVVELKSIERVPELHLATLVSYLRSADLPLGLLINFNVTSLRDGLFRRINARSTAIRSLPRPAAHRADAPTSLEPL